MTAGNLRVLIDRNGRVTIYSDGRIWRAGWVDEYAVVGNKGDRTKGFGNAVASNVAHWLGRFCVVALSGHVGRSERAA